MCLCIALLPPLRAWAEPPKPNVIFILVDDMGWGDLGVFYQNERGTAPKFETPNLDVMAAEGIQLRRHYCAAPVCAPARASLLTGVHQGHANVRDNQFDKALANNHTLGTVLQQAGYATAVIGKWGLQGAGLPAPARPELRGFDYFFGFLEHLDAHWHYPKEMGGNFYEGTTEITSELDKCYSTDLFTARAKKWILDHNDTNPSQPFFLYLAYTAPHARLNVPTQAYPAGLGEFGGLQWIGTPGHMINTASGTIDSYIFPQYASEGWPAAEKRHATMIRRLDHAVADIIQTLKDRGIDDDTLIVFTSDNGPHNETGNGGTYRQDPTFFDSFGPMDGIKRDSWEGGIREPMLVRWPGHIPAGVVSSTPSQFQDWMPTLAEVAGVPPPARSDGVSLLPTLTGIGTQKESTIYVEYDGGGRTPNYLEFEYSRRNAIRRQEQVVYLDGYKGIRYNVTSATDNFQIFNTLTDPKEASNLAGASAYFVTLQQRMKDRVLQIRRPGDEARPYDDALVPAVTVANTIPGLNYKAFEGTYPWVPDFTSLSPAISGVSAGLDLGVRTRDENIGLVYSGYLDVPTDGIYTIYLQTDGRAFLELHESGLIDADFGFAGGTERSATIRLEAGRHPLRLSYIRGSGGTPSLTLQWSGPGMAKQPIPAASLLRVNDGVLIVNDDSATAITEVPLTIDVLANDSAGSGAGPLAITNVTLPDHGISGLTGGGKQILYSSSPGYAGPDSFTYTVSDGVDSASATVTLNVVANIVPVANPDFATTPAETSVSIPVLANDTDDGLPSPLGISTVSAPNGGSAVISGDQIIYTPNAGVSGDDSFNYTITDGQDSATAQVTVTILPPAGEIWLPLDETSGTEVHDPLGQAIGTLQNFPSAPWETGHLNGALTFDGADDMVVLNGEKGVAGTAARTVSFWVNVDANQTAGTRPTMISWGNVNTGSAPGTRFDINLNHSHGYMLRAEFNSSGINFFTDAQTDLRGAGWVHCAIVVPADAKVSDVLGYINGVPATGTTQPASTGSTLINTSAVGNVTLGRMSDGSGGRAFKGMMDDVRIYPRVLTPGEIAALAAETPNENLQDQWFFQQTGTSNPTDADWTADPDHDGFTTFLEFALGGNPAINSQDIAPVLTSKLDFIFNRRREGISPDDYVVEVSTNLDQPDPWQTHVPTSVVPHPSLEGFDQVTVNLSGFADADAVFVRLRVKR